MSAAPRRESDTETRPEGRHVIDVYVHRTETVTCTCGWVGSSALTARKSSAWKEHLASNRPKR